MYSKLRSEGYPTDQLERADILRKLNIARWPSELSILSEDGKRRHLQAAPSKTGNENPQLNPQNLIYPHITSPYVSGHQSKQELYNTHSMPTALNSSRIMNGSGPQSNLPFTSTTSTEQFEQEQLFTLPEELSMSQRFDTAAFADFQLQDAAQWEVGGVNCFPDFGIAYPDEVFKTPLLSAAGICPDTSEDQTDSRDLYSFELAGALANSSPEKNVPQNSVQFVNDHDSPYPPETPSPLTQSTTSTSKPRLTTRRHFIFRRSVHSLVAEGNP